MEKEVIHEIDRAALELSEVLDAYDKELNQYLDPKRLKALRTEVVNLRQSMLGVQMGVLYIDWGDGEDLPEVGKDSVAEIAARVAEKKKTSN